MQPENSHTSEEDSKKYGLPIAIIIDEKHKWYGHFVNIGIVERENKICLLIKNFNGYTDTFSTNPDLEQKIFVLNDKELSEKLFNINYSKRVEYLKEKGYINK